jgi:hypothetical protein
VQDLAQGKQGTLCGTGGTQICAIPRLEPGQTYHVLIRVTWQPPEGLPNWNFNSGAVYFRVRSETPDLNTGNNDINNNFIMCQEGSTFEQCKHPTS